MRAALRADMTTLVEVLRADMFDSATFARALNRQRARLETDPAAILAALTREITAMNDARRSAFAERLEQQMRRGPPPHDN